MSYPRNAASPEPIAIGAVIQISDGAVQTSGVTVRIKPIGVGIDGDGGGSTAYSTDGIVLYTPTQAETNYTSFVLIAKKTGCIPVAITVVTSASATGGYAGLDWSKVTNPTTTVGLSGTTIGFVTDVSQVSGVSHGSLTLNPDGNFSYTHDGSENFTDSFTYRITDNDGQTSDATVSITITPVSDATPVANAPLNIMCSKRCAKPVRPLRSSIDPT